jgi:hypothetical protein
MTTEALFCSLSPLQIAKLIRSAQRAVCYAAPGIQLASINLNDQVASSLKNTR